MTDLGSLLWADEKIKIKENLEVVLVKKKSIQNTVQIVGRVKSLGKEVPFNFMHDLHIFTIQRKMQAVVREWILIFFRLYYQHHKIDALAIYCQSEELWTVYQEIWVLILPCQRCILGVEQFI